MTVTPEEATLEPVPVQEPEPLPQVVEPEVSTPMQESAEAMERAADTARAALAEAQARELDSLGSALSSVVTLESRMRETAATLDGALTRAAELLAAAEAHEAQAAEVLEAAAEAVEEPEPDETEEPPATVPARQMQAPPRRVRKGRLFS